MDGPVGLTPSGKEQKDWHVVFEHEVRHSVTVTTKHWEMPSRMGSASLHRHSRAGGIADSRGGVEAIIVVLGHLRFSEEAAVRASCPRINNVPRPFMVRQK
jgi:hypothetical protein